MSAEFGGGWMNDTAAGYRTVVSTVSPPIGGIQLLVRADPRRWYLRIATSSTAGQTASLAPGPIPAGLTVVPSSPLPVEVKFRDAPSMCVGEWYVTSPGAVTYQIWEVLYVRD